MGVCHKKNNLTAKRLVNILKTSIFCGAKGSLTFSLACLSYLEYSLCDYMLRKSNNQEDDAQKIKLVNACLSDGDGNVAESEVRGKKHNPYKSLREGNTFAMKRNIIPFIEMITIVPFACFALPIMIPGISLLQCALICAALMVATCFIVRSFNLRENLICKYDKYTQEQIKTAFRNSDIAYPIFNQDRKHIQYNSPEQGQLLSEKNNTSFLVKLLTFPLKVLQSCILFSLAVVELLETVPNLFVDMVCGGRLENTKNGFKILCHLLYGSARNMIPVLSKFDGPVAEFIGNPQASCCSV